MRRRKVNGLGLRLGRSTKSDSNSTKSPINLDGYCERPDKQHNWDDFTNERRCNGLSKAIMYFVNSLSFFTNTFYSFDHWTPYLSNVGFGRITNWLGFCQPSSLLSGTTWLYCYHLLIKILKNEEIMFEMEFFSGPSRCTSPRLRVQSSSLLRNKIAYWAWWWDILQIGTKYDGETDSKTHIMVQR